MATKLGKMADKLNTEFRNELAMAMSAKFSGLVVESYFDFLGSGRLVTTRPDGEDFTAEQIEYLKAFSDGFLAAMQLVRSEI